MATRHPHMGGCEEKIKAAAPAGGCVKSNFTMAVIASAVPRLWRSQKGKAVAYEKDMAMEMETA